MPETTSDLDTALRDAALATIWQDSPDDVARALAHVLRSAVEAVPGAVAGGLTRIDDGVPHGVHATDTAVEELHRLQAEHREGPALTAVVEHRDTLVIDDLRDPPAARWWPTVAGRAVSLGLRSLVCRRLPVDAAQPVASLTLYGRHAGVFDDEARRTVAVFAAHAAVLLDGGRAAPPPSSGDLLAQARGIVMERFGVDHHRALSQLMHTSAATGLSVTAVAHWLVDEAGRRAAPSPDRRVPPDDGRVAAQP
ncbi:GAF domain-containing protein [Actinomycetospora chiangmaiensis]|uniref:GAF domain-containing protein n=1 Tax=Actinomycetospora chiangmaiensis TaxID=402650 RepID=UPI00037B4EB7|nr:GAF domain-containing protein [Actinomycetospora chiangmaiensis]